MSISRDAILLDNIKASLSLYQRSLVWAATAALSGLLIAFRLSGGTPQPVEVLSGEVSAPIAWAIAQVLYLVFGALALSAVRAYRTALDALCPSAEILYAITLYPSLATLPNSFFRVGSVLLPPVVTAASWVVEIRREHQSGAETDSWWWVGAVMATFLLLAPYLGILQSVGPASGRSSAAPRQTDVPPHQPQGAA